MTSMARAMHFPNRSHELRKVSGFALRRNPHQPGGVLSRPETGAGALSNYRQLQGKELSYNNIADADAGWELREDIRTTACVIVKHANPCGVPSPRYGRKRTAALQNRPDSAFGGIIAFNRRDSIWKRQNGVAAFMEVLMRRHRPDAGEALGKETNVRFSKCDRGSANLYDSTTPSAGLLVQTPTR